MSSPPAVTTQSLADHNLRVSSVVAGINNKPAGKKISIRKNTVTHQIHNDAWRSQCHRVDVSALNNILGYRSGLDQRGNPCTFAICEGQVSMKQLVQAALPFGLSPYCVPEFPTFTCAGLINGEGIQSSAFRYGVFTQSVGELEVVLGNGEVVLTSHTDDLFSNVVESYGCMGIVTMVAVALRPSKQFVRSSYTLFNNLPEFIRAFDTTVRATEGDFLEALVLSKDRYLMIHSHFTDEVGNLPFYDPKPFDTESGDRWYYQHVLQVVVSKDGSRINMPTDVIPTEGFVFRGARGLWWMLEGFIGCKALTNQPWFRVHCDRKVAVALKTTGFKPAGVLNVEETQRSVVNQDMGIKLSRLEEGINYVNKNVGVYPLWLCPIDLRDTHHLTAAQVALHPSKAKALGERFFVDIGVYGEPTVTPFYHRRTIKALQEFVDLPSSWGVSYKSRDDIKKEWDPIRAKYHAIDAFPGVEEKTSFRCADEDAANNELPIPYWRFVNEFGWNWRWKFAGAGLFLAGSLTAATWFVLQSIALLTRN